MRGVTADRTSCVSLLVSLDFGVAGALLHMRRLACGGLTRHFAASGGLWLRGVWVGAIEALLPCRFFLRGVVADRNACCVSLKFF